MVVQPSHTVIKRKPLAPGRHPNRVSSQQPSQQHRISQPRSKSPVIPKKRNHVPLDTNPAMAQDTEEDEDQQRKGKRKFDEVDAILSGSFDSEKKPRDSSTLIIDGFHNLGRFFSRAINPFLSVVNVLQAGVVYEGFKDLEMGEDIILDDEDEEDDSQDPEAIAAAEAKAKNERCLLVAYKLLIKQSSTLKEYLAYLDSTQNIEIFLSLARTLQQHANQARTCDTNTIKTSILLSLYPDSEYGAWPAPPLAGAGKSDRGVNHKYIASLLCPWEYLSELHSGGDERPAEIIEDIQNGNIVLSSSQLMGVLYSIGDLDADDCEAGLMRGYLPIWMFRAIFTGPRTAVNGPKSAPAKSSNAKLHKITQAQPEMIAYSVVQTLFALSTKESWAVNDGVFDYSEFFDNIVALFKDRKSRWVKKTLKWWNLQVFGHESGLASDKPSAAPVDSKSTFADLLAKRDAQKQKKIAALAASLALIPTASPIGHRPSASSAPVASEIIPGSPSY